MAYKYLRYDNNLFNQGSLLNPLLLDLYPNASAAYSLRKLRIGYSGSCIRVRRSSDNAELDIGFVSGVLDAATLLTFVGVGNDGFITNWYDQSGNSNDAYQIHATAQPNIVINGSIVTDALGNLSIKFTPNLSIFKIDAKIVELSKNAASVFCVSDSNNMTGPSNGYILAEADVIPPDTYSSNFILGSTEGRPLWVNNVLFGSVISGVSLMGFDWNQSVFQVYTNGSVNGEAKAATVNPEVGTAAIGGYADGAVNGRTGRKISELICYKSNKYADRADIDTLINDYYSIY